MERRFRARAVRIDSTVVEAERTGWAILVYNLDTLAVRTA